jgi:hypothetical protein
LVIAAVCALLVRGRTGERQRPALRRGVEEEVEIRPRERVEDDWPARSPRVTDNARKRAGDAQQLPRANDDEEKKKRRVAGTIKM